MLLCVVKKRGKMKRLYRDRWDKKIAGVCGGLGRFLGVDPNLLRLLVLALCLFTACFPVVICYFLSWIFIPPGPSTYIQFAHNRLYRSRTNRKIAGVCGGIAEMLAISPTVVRVLSCLLLIITGIIPLAIVYLSAIALVPEKIDTSFRRKR